MKVNENNFISLIRKGREEGILYVIETYSGLLHAIFRKRLFMAPDRIEECMNDIFLGIWRNIDSFDESRGSFEGWAAGIARLEAVNILGRILEESEKDISAAELAEIQLSGEKEEIFRNLNKEDQERFRRIFLKEAESGNAGDARGIRDNMYVRIFRKKRKSRRKKKEGIKA